MMRAEQYALHTFRLLFLGLLTVLAEIGMVSGAYAQAESTTAPVELYLEYAPQTFDYQGAYQHFEPGDGMFRITSMADDDITVYGLKATDGTCRINDNLRLANRCSDGDRECVVYLNNVPNVPLNERQLKPTLMKKYNEVYLFFSHCLITDATVMTSKGNWNFNWGRPGKPGWHEIP